MKHILLTSVSKHCTGAALQDVHETVVTIAFNDELGRSLGSRSTG